MAKVGVIGDCASALSRVTDYSSMQQCVQQCGRAACMQPRASKKEAEWNQFAWPKLPPEACRGAVDAWCASSECDRHSNATGPAADYDPADRLGPRANPRTPEEYQSHKLHGVGLTAGRWRCLPRVHFVMLTYAAVSSPSPTLHTNITTAATPGELSCGSSSVNKYGSRATTPTRLGFPCIPCSVCTTQAALAGQQVRLQSRRRPRGSNSRTALPRVCCRNGRVKTIEELGLLKRVRGACSAKMLGAGGLARHTVYEHPLTACFKEVIRKHGDAPSVAAAVAAELRNARSFNDKCEGVPPELVMQQLAAREEARRYGEREVCAGGA